MCSHMIGIILIWIVKVFRGNNAWLLFNMDYKGVWGLFEIVILCQLAFGSCAAKKLVRSLLC